MARPRPTPSEPSASPAFLADALAAHVAPWAKESERFVFESIKGGPLVYGIFYGSHFRPAVARALPDSLHFLRFHDLRQTAATPYGQPPWC